MPARASLRRLWPHKAKSTHGSKHSTTPKSPTSPKEIDNFLDTKAGIGLGPHPAYQAVSSGYANHTTPELEGNPTSRPPLYEEHRRHQPWTGHRENISMHELAHDNLDDIDYPRSELPASRAIEQPQLLIPAALNVPTTPKVPALMVTPSRPITTDRGDRRVSTSLVPGLSPNLSRPPSRNSLSPRLSIDTQSICSKQSTVSGPRPSSTVTAKSDNAPSPCTSEAPSPKVKHSPVSEASCSSPRDQRQATILSTEGQTWVFPNVDVNELVSRIKNDNVKIEELVDSGRGRSKRFSPYSLSPTSGSDNRSSNRANGNSNLKRKGSPISPQSNGSRRAASQAEDDGHTKFGCPYAKHNPERYSDVHNQCTRSPGIPWKYMTEHIKRVHSAETKCIYCNKVWSTANWELELLEHRRVGPCVAPEEIRSKPETMSPDQARVYKETGNEQGDHDRKWVGLYMRLFPDDCWPIPYPRYDYYVATHRIITPTSSNNSSPVDDDQQQNGPQTREWYLYAQTNSLQNAAAQTRDDVFSSPVNQTSHNQNAFGAQRANSSPDSLQLPMPSGLAPDNGIWDDNFPAPGGGDMYEYHVDNLYDSTSTLVVPEMPGDGSGLLHKWEGQNIPQNISPQSLGSMFGR